MGLDDTDGGAVIDSGVDQEVTTKILNGMIEVVKAHLPTNAMTILSAGFSAAADLALMVGISEDDTVDMVRRIYQREMQKLKDSMSTAEYAALLARIASQSLRDGDPPPCARPS